MCIEDLLIVAESSLNLFVRALQKALIWGAPREGAVGISLREVGIQPSCVMTSVTSSVLVQAKCFV